MRSTFDLKAGTKTIGINPGDRIDADTLYEGEPISKTMALTDDEKALLERSKGIFDEGAYTVSTSKT